MAHTNLFNCQIHQAAREVAQATVASTRTFALASLYDLTADRLVRFSVTVTRRQHDAEDAVATVMLKVASRPEILLRAERPWHYLLRMVRNESLVIVRSRSRLASIGSMAERLMGRSIDVVERDDERRVIWQALETLPFDQREVIVLKIWEQLTFAEIAEILELSPSTAASRYRYGLEKLSAKLVRLLGDEHGGDESSDRKHGVTESDRFAPSRRLREVI
ncbi:RNA polymerase sigma factor [Roseiconus lacunae]|uniref:Sigma-70 family RNA polymerase sigma factor n=1 Tax=Roseiconus lacunae TaxID=2605694 RepID=A0ABT7PJ81_9BACT|nr:sigma-70 family RNA polymerase sigma factor [Roseiconus lacunae]MDM4016246.1 sigma-70 family RNA polymerase sigma factor [Roseiconus lacunae]